LLTNGQANQKALAHRIAAKATIAAVVVSKNIPKKKAGTIKRFRLLINAAFGRSVGRPFVETWNMLLAAYEAEFLSFPSDNVIQVDNVNDGETLGAIEAHSPDLVVVSGTNIVGRKIIEAASDYKGIVNLHTGISPYVKGGPNCTNWCLAKGWFHLIGNTVMWLDRGIDTGNIIATEQTKLDGSETLFELHKKVMDHAHAVYADVIGKIGRGEPVPSVAQSEIGNGTQFNSADWNGFQMRRALTNFRTSYKPYFAEDRVHSLDSASLKLLPTLDV
jgi:methionyl-tRNA formyltransferase